MYIFGGTPACPHQLPRASTDAPERIPKSEYTFPYRLLSCISTLDAPSTTIPYELLMMYDDKIEILDTS